MSVPAPAEGVRHSTSSPGSRAVEVAVRTDWLRALSDASLAAGLPRVWLREMLLNVATIAVELAVEDAVELIDTNGVPLDAVEQLVTSPRSTAAQVVDAVCPRIER